MTENKYATTLVDSLVEEYENTGWPSICDGDLMLAYFDVPEDV